MSEIEAPKIKKTLVEGSRVEEATKSSIENNLRENGLEIVKFLEDKNFFVVQTVDEIKNSKNYGYIEYTLKNNIRAIHKNTGKYRGIEYGQTGYDVETRSRRSMPQAHGGKGLNLISVETIPEGTKVCYRVIEREENGVERKGKEKYVILSFHEGEINRHNLESRDLTDFEIYGP